MLNSVNQKVYLRYLFSIFFKLMSKVTELTSLSVLILKKLVLQIPCLGQTVLSGSDNSGHLKQMQWQGKSQYCLIVFVQYKLQYQNWQTKTLVTNKLCHIKMVKQL